jgi:hypothetical protein
VPSSGTSSPPSPSKPSSSGPSSKPA